MADGLSLGDPNSFSNPEHCVVSDIHLNLDVDFEREILSGYADITVEKNKDNPADHVVLDTKGLTIHSVKNKNTRKKLSYSLGSPVDNFGSKLEIKVPKTTSRFTVRIDYETSKHSTALQWMKPAQTAGKQSVIRIEYETSAEASALQWLEPTQTAGKKHPYMFSQCQAIHARSMFPCQDTPSVKATYSAVIRAPSELVVLMSAIHDGEAVSDDPQKRAFKFVQKVPIPSYLIAIVVGALESRKLGPRSHVWSEKEYIEKAAYEFAETEKMLTIAEELLGPYIWEIYDLLVLPPSFPFGGMENPCLTFVTPTLLAGDRSLADVVVHEISHSWTGNLVTNTNFEHFWLNEGFTVFVERKIGGRMHGDDFRKFQATGGWKELEYTVQTRGKDDPLTKLVPDLKGIDPDDAFSTVPYEKGHTLLFYLEEILGGPEPFENFLKAYIEKYKYKSIDTDEWKTFLYEHFKDKKEDLDKVDWDAWLYTPGMPPVHPDYSSSLADRCTALCASWVNAASSDLSEFSEKDIEGMISPQICEFLAQLLQKGEKLRSISLSSLPESISLILNRHANDALLGYACINKRFPTAEFQTSIKDLNVFCCYAPTEDTDEDEKDSFYGQLQDIFNCVKKGDISLVLGEFISKVGSDSDLWEGVIGTFHIGSCNDNGQHLLREPLSEEKIQKLTELYHMEKVTNSEIHFKWLRLGLRSKWKPVIPHVIKFVTEQGRMKFVRPLYRDLYEWEETRDLAISTYREHVNEMMYVTAYTVGKDLHLEKTNKISQG